MILWFVYLVVNNCHCWNLFSSPAADISVSQVSLLCKFGNLFSIDMVFILLVVQKSGKLTSWAWSFIPLSKQGFVYPNGGLYISKPSTVWYWYCCDETTKKSSPNTLQKMGAMGAYSGGSLLPKVGPLMPLGIDRFKRQTIIPKLSDFFCFWGGRTTNGR